MRLWHKNFGLVQLYLLLVKTIVSRPSELFRPYLDYLYLNSNFTQLQLHIQSL